MVHWGEASDQPILRWSVFSGSSASEVSSNCCCLKHLSDSTLKKVAVVQLAQRLVVGVSILRLVEVVAPVEDFLDLIRDLGQRQDWPRCS